MIKTFIQWVVYSSKDPAKISLTIKGFVATVVSVLAVVGVNSIPQDQVNTLVDNFLLLVTQVSTIISTLVTVYGGARKLWLTLFPAI